MIRISGAAKVEKFLEFQNLCLFPLLLFVFAILWLVGIAQFIENLLTYIIFWVGVNERSASCFIKDEGVIL